MNAFSKEYLADLLEHPQGQEELFERARRVRADHFGDEVYAYGFNYFSTYCRNDCSFCQYRRSNPQAIRYRHLLDEVVDSAKKLAASGVHLIDLTMGEDPYYLDRPERLVQIVEAVSQETGLAIMVSPGVVDSSILPDLKKAGATWLALYQETFDSEAYANLRIGQSFDERMELKRATRESGLLVEEGLLVGWGDSSEQVASSLLEMGGAGPSQVRVMTFVPQRGTPLEALPPQTSERELVAIALLRLLYPDLLIPASLDVEGPAGLKARLDAGANVITSIIPPNAGLEGVARNEDIDDGGRTLESIMPTIEAAGMKLASQESYNAFLHRARNVSRR